MPDEIERELEQSRERERALQEGLSRAINLLDAEELDRSEIDPLRALAGQTEQAEDGS